MESLVSFDHTISHAIHLLPHPLFIDIIFNFFSLRGIFALVWLVVFLLFMKYHERDGKFSRLLFLSLLSTTILVNFVMKNIVDRPRPLSLTPYIPSMADSIPFLFISKTYPSDYAFPSGHASLAFCAAFIFSYFYKKNSIYFYSIATVIAFSRVYLGFHYVSDVFFGALFGLLIGWATVHYYDKV